MSPEWQARLSRLGLGMLFGQKPKEILVEQVTEIAADKIGVTILSTSDRTRLQIALTRVDNIIETTFDQSAEAYARSAKLELEAVLK